MEIITRSVKAFGLFDHLQFAATFSNIGWKTPDTYVSGHFGTEPPVSGLYVFTSTHLLTRLVRALYVGQSVNIARRWKGHEIERLIKQSFTADDCLARWFLPVDRKSLRVAERTMIGELNPPFNIIGRTRGRA